MELCISRERLLLISRAAPHPSARQWTVLVLQPGIFFYFFPLLPSHSISGAVYIYIFILFYIFSLDLPFTRLFPHFLLACPPPLPANRLSSLRFVCFPNLNVSFLSLVSNPYVSTGFPHSSSYYCNILPAYFSVFTFCAILFPFIVPFSAHFLRL
jgi:hypothetical protein